MSTHYRPLEPIRARDLFDGRLEKFGIREHFAADSSEKNKCLTDGRNYLWVWISDAGMIQEIYGAIAPGKILSAIGEAFATDIVSERQPQYWSFETQEEWDAWQDKLGKEDAEKFYADVLKYLRGEPNNLPPGSVGMIKAEIAKQLVEKDCGLLLPENKDKLLAEMQSIYRRDHEVSIELTPQDIAFAELIATHEDDLPQA